VGGAAEHGPGQKRKNTDQENRLPAEDIGQTARNGDDDGGGQHVNREGPGIMLDTLQLIDDGFHRRADDGGIQRGKQQARHQRRQD